jgi:hypothetical protein
MDDHFAIRQAPSNCSSLRRSWAGTGDPGGPPVTTNPRPVSVTPMLIVEFDFRRRDCDPSPLRCHHQGHQEALGRTPISRCRVQMPWRGRCAPVRPAGRVLHSSNRVFRPKKEHVQYLDHAPRSGRRGLREANMRLARLPATAGPLRLRPARRCQSWARALPKSRCHGHWLLGREPGTALR